MTVRDSRMVGKIKKEISASKKIVNTSYFDQHSALDDERYRNFKHLSVKKINSSAVTDLTEGLQQTTVSVVDYEQTIETINRTMI